MVFTVLTDQEKQLPLYLKSIGIKKNQEKISRPNGLPSYQWTYCNHGEGLFRVDNEEHRIIAGTGFFFYPHTAHSYEAISEPWETWWLTFDGSASLPLLEHLKIKRWTIFSTDDASEFLHEFDRMEKQLNSNSLNRMLEASATLYSFIVRMQHLKPLSETKQIGLQTKRLSPVIRYMEKHYHSQISLKDLSDTAGVTPPHLCKLFKREFSISPVEYLTRIRMQAAKELLVQSSELRIKEIAYRVSYKDVSYFCTVFKKYEDLSPQGFRQLHGIR